MDGVQPGHRLDLERDRQARRRLEPGADAPEAEQGFLLNHLISDCCPRRTAADRYANADPVTGQAAWFDLRVRIDQGRDGRRDRAAVRAAAAARRTCRSRPDARYGAPRSAPGETHDQPAAHPSPKSSAWSSTSTPASAATPAPSTARNGTPAAIAAPLTDSMPYGAEPDGVWFNRVHSLRGRRGRATRPHASISRAPACIAGRRPASPSARPAPPTSAPRTASCWSTRTSASAASLCAWACPYGAREIDAGRAA